MAVITRNKTRCRDLLISIGKHRVENRINKENQLNKKLYYKKVIIII